MRLCSAVVNISYDMKLVNGKLFDGISKSNNYALSVIVADDGVKNLVVVAVKIVEVYACGEKFFNYIRKSGIKRLRSLERVYLLLILRPRTMRLRSVALYHASVSSTFSSSSLIFCLG